MKQTTQTHGEISLRNTQRQGRMRQWLCQSAIIHFFSLVCNAIYQAVKNSWVGTFFSSYTPLGDRIAHSFFPSLHRKLRIREHILRPMKFSVARLLNDSYLLNMLRRFLAYLLSLPLYGYGLFLICFGAAALLVQGIPFLFGGTAVLTPTEILFAITAIVISFLLFSTSKNLAYGLAHSIFSELLLFRLIGARREDFVIRPNAHFQPLAPILLGIIAGGACYYLPMRYYCYALIALLALLTVMKIPEFGMVAVLFTLPYLPTKMLVAAILLICCSYLLKLIAGRRTLRFEVIDLFVVLFMVLYLLGGIFSSAPALSIGPMCVTVCFIFSYILMVNLIRSEVWFKRCAGAILCTTVLVSLYGIYQYVFGTLSAGWLDKEMFSSISIRVISTFGNPNVLGEFLVISIPLFYIYFFSRKGFSKKVLSLIPCGICLLCLVLTWSRGAWLGLIIGTLAFLLLYSRHSLTVLLFGSLGLQLLPYVLPQNVLLRFTSIGNMADSSTSYRVNIWLATLQMIRDYFFSGIGSGINVFKTIYPRYAYATIEAAPHSHSLFLQILVELGIFGLLVFLIILFFFTKQSCSALRDEQKNPLRFWVLAGFCGILSVIAQGATDYIFYNYRVMLWFWLCAGLTSAAARIVRRNAENCSEQLL